MKDKTVTLITHETIKKSELSEREKLIYDAGYSDGISSFSEAIITIICASIILATILYAFDVFG